jgi:predicted PurR-regulated permease PerM
LACVAAVGVCAGLGWLFAVAIDDLAADWPTYHQAWDRVQIQAVRWFWRHRLGASATVVRDLEPEEAAIDLALPGIALASRIGSSILLALMIAVFLLIEGAAVSPKLKRMEKLGVLDAAVFREAAFKVQRYLWIKSVTSFATGVLVAALTAAVGLRHALLFGLLAFVFNFIPNVGALLALIPAMLLGLLTMGWSANLELIVGYGLIHIVIGLVLEPRWMSEAAGLSPSIVVLSMVFWGFVLGPAGALLSVPLMMIVRITAGQSPDWAWLEILLESPKRAFEDEGKTP